MIDAVVGFGKNRGGGGERGKGGDWQCKVLSSNTWYY